MTDTKPQPSTPVDLPVKAGVLARLKLWSLPDNKAGRAAKYVCYRCFRLTGEFTAIVLGIALFWAIAINIVLARGSVDISFLEKNAGLWFSQAFDGRDASVGRMTLDWNPAGNSVIFRAANVSITDENAREIQHVDVLSSEIGITRVLSGQLDPRKLMIQGGAVTWLRDEEGKIKAGLGTPETVGKLGPVWTGRRARPRERGVFSLGGLEEIIITDAVAYLQNNRDGLNLQFSDTNINVNNTGEVFDFNVETNLIAGESGTPIKLNLVLSPDFKDFNLELSGTRLNPKDIAPERNHFAIMSGLDALIDVNLAMISTREAGLRDVDLALIASKGRLDTKILKQGFDSAALIAAYDPASETLRITQMDVKADDLDITGTASLLNIGAPSEGFFKEAVGFSVDLADLKLDATPFFERAFDFESVNVAGSYLYTDRAAEFTRIDLNFGKFATDFTGRVKRTDDGSFEHIRLDGPINGVLSPEDLLSLWPQEFALGARDWIDRAILKADLKDFRLRLDAPREALNTGRLNNEHLDLMFTVANADVRYISTMTPLSQAYGDGHLRGNAFDIAVSQGTVGNLVIDSGRVDIPVLSPKGGDLIVDIKGHGAVPDLLSLIDEKPFEFVSRYGVNPSEFSGQGNVNLKITRPLLVNFNKDRIQYSVDGRLTDVTAPFALGPHKVTNGTVKLSSDKNGLQVNGPIKIGPWNADLEWREIFDNGATPSMFKVSGILGRDDLDGFGIGFRQYFTGNVPLTIEAHGRGIAITDARINADLKDAEIQVGSYWSKAAGIPGSFTGNMARADDGAASIENMAVDAPGMTLRGSLNLANNFRLINLNMTEAKIENFIDASLKASPDPNNERFSIFMTGDFLDISPFVTRSVTTQTSDMDVPISLTGALKRLVLKPNYEIADANVLFTHNGIGVTQARLKGQASAGPFIVDMVTETGAARRVLTAEIPDAASAATAFLGLTNIAGGRLTVEAVLPIASSDGPLQGIAKIEDFQLVEAPALAQMLSMASLTGLGNVLGGEGIKFDRFEVPFSLQDNLLQIRGARVSGPAIGLTGDGDMNLTTMALDFDGVLVPAYSANSVLGSIPLLGDILVGKKGEGIFALSYTVKGTYDEFQVVVNPLSALTPGFLRGIFKPSRKKMVDPDVIKEIEDVTPKAFEKN